MKPLLSVLAALACCLAYAQPIRIASNSHGDSFVDPKDVTFNDRGFIFKMVSNSKADPPISNGRVVASMEFLYEVNCKNKQERLLRAIAFDEPFLNGRVLETAAPDKKWTSISQGSVTDVLQKELCK